MDKGKVFQTKVVDGAFLIKVPGNLGPSEAEVFESEFSSWLLQPETLHVFDFSSTLEITRNIFPILTKYRRLLEENEKSMASIQLSRRLLQEILTVGMKSVFNPAESLNEARKRAGLLTSTPKLKVDAEFLSPFIKGTMTTFETQAGLKLDPGKPFAKKEADPKGTDIAGVINLNSSDFTGAIALCFTASTFLKIYEGLVGEKHESVNEEVQDAAGELLNILYGLAKTEMKEMGYDVHMAIPTILVGEKIRISYQCKCPILVIPFASAAGSFHLEIVIEETS